MITITDVATKAGVSRATVSYVLNNSQTSVKLSADTRARVLEVAAELGYRRNELARAVTTGKSPMLGFWVMQSNREPVVRVLSGAMKETEESNHFIKMIGFDNGALDSRTLERCQEWRLAGIIAIHAPEVTMKELYPRITASGIPFVMVNSQKPPIGCVNVEADSTAGMRALVEHLAGLGHQRIAFLGGQNEHLDSISAEREHAYRATMCQLGLQSYCQVEAGNWTEEFSCWEQGETAAAGRRLLDANPRPTAIACASDHIAMIVMRLAAERGLQVPEDLSVTGFDDVAVSTLYNPPITTVAQPFEEMGRAAVRYLLEKVDDQRVSVPTLPTQLVLRGSTAAVNKFKITQHHKA